MTTNKMTRRVHMTSILPLVLVLFLATSCASKRQIAATPAPSGPADTPLLPTSASRVAQTATPSLPTQVVPVHPGTIAFEIVAPGYHDDIYLIQTDGTGLTRLTETNTSADNPAWSPDGTKIAYNVCDQKNDDPYDVWVMNADGTGQTQLTHGPLGGSFPAWSPDGTQIAYSTWFYPQEEYGPAQIYVMDADGSNPRRVTNGYANDLFPKWAPDGTILFLRKEHGYGSSVADIFAINPDGTGLVRLTTMGYVGGFALSPDGTKIAIHDLAQHQIVVVPMNASGNPVTLVDTDFGYDFIAIAWSPDGEALALVRQGLMEFGGYELHIVNADGTGLTTVPNAKAACDVAWRPR